MRLIFAGTPDFSVGCLQALIAADHELVAVYCQPDRPAGRGRKLQAGPVKQCALEHDIPVYQPLTLKGQDDQAAMQALNADLMVVVAYGLLLPQAVLDIPRYGCINVHASLLPRWRGAAPIQRCIEAGDTETGVTIMQMDAGLDTGDMLQKVVLPIGAEITGGELHDTLAIAGAKALVETIVNIPDQLNAEAQDNALANYAHKLNKQGASIDWSQSAEALVNKIRAFNPWPVCWSELNGQRLRIWNAVVSPDGSANRAQAGQIISADTQGVVVSTGEGTINITVLQAAGGKALPVALFANGHDLSSWAGQHFNA